MFSVGSPSTNSRSAFRPGAMRPLSDIPNKSAVTLVLDLKTSVGDKPALSTSRNISMCRLAPKTSPGAPQAASEPLSASQPPGR